MKVVSFGGGVNSTALLVGMLEREQRPDAILFADTGGEYPGTYRHVEDVSAWCSSEGFPPITVVSNAGQHASLEAECLTNGTLPSLAFGFKGCSVKWKRQPMDRWLRKDPDAQAAWDSGERVQRLIGIDAGEAHRGQIPDDKRFTYHFPLIEWGWDRDNCLAAGARHGLNGAKSACWYCPASRKAEVLSLAEHRGDLFARAVAMEHNAAESLGAVKGLGRHWSWEQLAAADRAQARLFPDMIEAPCGCFDGEQD